MALSIGVVMDPISQIKIAKDSTFAMLLAAQKRGYSLYYMEINHLMLRDGRPFATACKVEVKDDPADWYSLGQVEEVDLADLDAILMRKDPPFNMDYVYATYVLERAETDGTLIVNRPQSLRDCNEKLFTAWFPEHCPKTLVASQTAPIREFLSEHKDIILKPLDGMGGASIFRVKQEDPNISVIIETLTNHGQHLAMAQEFIPEISEGDKRILMVNGQPIPYSLARIPAQGETRGNLAAGGRGVAMPLTDAEKSLAQAVGPALIQRGLIFVGLDVIGGKLTEINVTSPTCIREIDAAYDTDIAGKLMDAIAKTLEKNHS